MKKGRWRVGVDTHTFAKSANVWGTRPSQWECDEKGQRPRPFFASGRVTPHTASAPEGAPLTRIFRKRKADPPIRPLNFPPPETGQAPSLHARLSGADSAPTIF